MKGQFTHKNFPATIAAANFLIAKKPPVKRELDARLYRAKARVAFDEPRASVEDLEKIMELAPVQDPMPNT